MARTSSLSRTARLVQAVRDLASAREMSEVVEVVRHAARELVCADGATFVLRDGQFCHYVDEDAIEPLWRGQRFPLEACISGWAMLHGEAVAIPDIYLDARIPHDAYRPTFVRSLVMTPVRAADPIAAIGTYWAHNHVATETELVVLQALADSTAVAINSVRVLEGLEHLVRERTAELAAANRDLRAFAGLAAHDLRDPLMTAGAYIETALRTDREQISDECAAALEEAQRANERMSDLIAAILEYSTVAQADVLFDTVDFTRVFTRVRANLAALIESRGAELAVAPGLPVGHGHEALIERAMQNLVSKAIVYGDPVRPVVTVDGGRNDDGSIWVVVSDNGAGVRDTERGAIFEMFRRGDSGVSTAGFGLGLGLVARVVEKHHGTVAVGDAPMGGAAFTVTLPGAPPDPGARLEAFSA